MYNGEIDLAGIEYLELTDADESVVVRLARERAFYPGGLTLHYAARRFSVAQSGETQCVTEPARLMYTNTLHNIQDRLTAQADAQYRVTLPPPFTGADVEATLEVIGSGQPPLDLHVTATTTQTPSFVRTCDGYVAPVVHFSSSDSPTCPP
jgi:hypothetical protein